ncbi:hypothetical protein [Novipirellula herctigrandis]|uniref:hypothetical protein n=1 Tax=Novipirellula herctigrandis TaxID=2527986 RepID=UPI003AF3E4A8
MVTLAFLLSAFKSIGVILSRTRATKSTEVAYRWHAKSLSLACQELIAGMPSKDG